jgi:hypothetical protein
LQLRSSSKAATCYPHHEKPRTGIYATVASRGTARCCAFNAFQLNAFQPSCAAVDFPGNETSFRTIDACGGLGHASDPVFHLAACMFDRYLQMFVHSFLLCCFPGHSFIQVASPRVFRRHHSSGASALRAIVQRLTICGRL